MAGYIYAGSTPTIRFKPLNGISVSDATLGTPVIAIVQDERSVTYEGEDLTIDTVNNTISVKLDEEDTVVLVPGVPGRAQLIFYNEDAGESIRFPEHEFTVLPSLLGVLTTEEDEVPIEDVDADGQPYETETYELITDELMPAEEYEEYELEDYEEDYEDTLEGDPEELLPADDVEPADEEDDS